jgi:hypothetical protein
VLDFKAVGKSGGEFFAEYAAGRTPNPDVVQQRN